MSNSDVRFTVLHPEVQCLKEAVNQNRLKSLGHVSCLSTESAPRCTLLFEEGHSRQMGRGGQPITRKKM